MDSKRMFVICLFLSVVLIVFYSFSLDEWPVFNPLNKLLTSYNKTNDTVHKSSRDPDQVFNTLSTPFSTKTPRNSENKEDHIPYASTTKKSMMVLTAHSGSAAKRPLKKVILLWDTYNWFGYGAVSEPHHCGYCSITRNRSVITEATTAAVMIDARSDTFLNPPGDPYRQANQLYIFWTMESQGNTQRYGKSGNNLRLYDDYYFNGTLTFRRDSTFYTQTLNSNSVARPIDMIRSGQNGVESNTSKLLAKKDKIAVWFVSNCKGGSNGRNRIKLSEEMLKSGLKLDRYGKCFHNILAKRNRSEFNRILARYKFYLSFENSLHCKDYITEKFHLNALVAGLVPVVYGPVRENYEAMAPPHSFIHVEDFNSTKDLVDYLKYLDENDTAYAEYFAWRNMDAKSLYPYGKYMGFCALCRTLYGIPLDDKRPFEEIYGEKGYKYNSSVGLNFSQSIRSIYEWWHGNETKECLNVPRLPKVTTQ